MFFYEGSQVIIMMQIIIAILTLLVVSVCLIGVLLAILIKKIKELGQPNGDQPKTDPPSGGV